MPGVGATPFGSSPYGLGAIAAPAAPGTILRDPATGESRGARLLDPLTRDYVMDENGRYLGANETEQLVLIAVSTTKGTAAVRALGQELRKIKRITANFRRRAEVTLTAAVQHIVSRKLIAIRGVDVVELRPGARVIRLRWTDLQTGLDRTTES